MSFGLKRLPGGYFEDVKPAPKLPKKIKVGWRDYTIVEIDERTASQDGIYGQTRHITCEIRLQTRGCASRQIAHSLLHEILHTCARLFNATAEVPDQRREEHIVTTLSDGLSGVWRDNPEAFAYIHYHLLNGDAVL